MYTTADLAAAILIGFLIGALATRSIMLFFARRRRRQRQQQQAREDRKLKIAADYGADITGLIRTGADVEDRPQPAGIDARTKETLARALAALQAMQESAHTYKALADRLDAALAHARAQAQAAEQAAAEAEAGAAAAREDTAAAEEATEIARADADRHRLMYMSRTRQALGAGLRIVIDHAGYSAGGRPGGREEDRPQ